MPDEPDVAIIGAGCAGLAAARELAEHGLRVVILEATERVGGRAHTIHPYSGVPAELGPEYIHGEPEVTLRLMRAAGLQREQFSDVHQLSRDGALVSQPDFWSRFGRLLRNAPPPSRDISALEYMQRENMRKDDALSFAMRSCITRPCRFRRTGYASTVEGISSPRGPAARRLRHWPASMASDS